MPGAAASAATPRHPRVERPRQPELTGPRASGRRPGVLDVGEDLLARLVARDPVGQLGPERAGTDLTRHQVRAVEAEHRLRVLEQLCGELVDGGGEVLDVETRVRAHPARAGDLRL